MFGRRDPKGRGDGGTLNVKPSLISSDTRLTGDLDSDGELRIEGRVKGDIRCDRLTITELAEVHGNVEAKEVRLFGAIFGSVHAATVRLFETARLVGDVVHESLELEHGAEVDGHYSRQRFQRADVATRAPLSREAPPKPLAAPEKPDVPAVLVGKQALDSETGARRPTSH